MNQIGPARTALAAEVVRETRPAGGRLNPRDNLIRALVAAARGTERGLGGAEACLERAWPNDRHSMAVLRASVSPGTLDAAGWTAIASSTALADFVANLTPTSAASGLIRHAMNLDMAGLKTIRIPALAATASGASFVDEAEPAPVRVMDLSAGAILVPHKIGGLAVLSRELVRGSNAETVVRSLMAESVGPALDTTMFSDNAATAAAPAGLLHGAIEAVPSGGDMTEDIADLVATVAPIGGSSVMLVAGAAAYAKVKLRYPNIPWPLLTTGAVASNQIVAVAIPALVFGVDPIPIIDATNSGTVHMSDTPLPLVASGTAAAPTLSAWQTASVILRLSMSVSWTLRAPASVATLTGTMW